MQAKFVKTNSNVADLITSAGLLGNSLAKVSCLSAEKDSCFPPNKPLHIVRMLKQEQDSQVGTFAAISESARRSV